MRSIVMFFEDMTQAGQPLPQPVPGQSPVQLPPTPPVPPVSVVPVIQRLSPKLVAYMKKDPAFANEVQANLKNYETMAILRNKNIIKH
jgi:hypothetical protein